MTVLLSMWLTVPSAVVIQHALNAILVILWLHKELFVSQLVLLLIVYIVRIVQLHVKFVIKDMILLVTHVLLVLAILSTVLAVRRPLLVKLVLLVSLLLVAILHVLLIVLWLTAYFVLVLHVQHVWLVIIWLHLLHALKFALYLIVRHASQHQHVLFAMMDTN